MTNRNDRNRPHHNPAGKSNDETRAPYQPGGHSENSNDETPPGNHETDDDRALSRSGDTPPVTAALAGMIGTELDVLLESHVNEDPTVKALRSIFNGLLQSLDFLERKVQLLEDRANGRG